MGKLGLVILPDRFNLPAGLIFNEGLGLEGEFNLNSYSLEQWAQMEAAGAVLLYIRGGYSEGRYWTTTAADVNEWGTPISYVLHISGGYVGIAECGREGAHNGVAVRLVRDVQ